jgi:hypothetical protein
MILVDYGGSIFPIISHSPWNGVHLADFVMPFFLFLVGISLALAYKVCMYVLPLHSIHHALHSISHSPFIFIYQNVREGHIEQHKLHPKPFLEHCNSLFLGFFFKVCLFVCL